MYLELLPPWHQEEAQDLFKRCCFILDEMQKDVDFSNNIIREKYNDFWAIPSDFVRLIIEEFGFGYITEVLSFNDEQLKSMLSYIAAIHALKGHKEGLELVFKLMGIEATLEEWWEKAPKGEPDTFTMSVNVDLSRIQPNTSTLLREFISHYVYPILESLKFEYRGIIFSMIISMGGCHKYISEAASPGLFWWTIRMGGVQRHIMSGTVRF